MEKSLELKEKENKSKKGICRIELQVYGTLEKRVEFKQLKATRCLFSFEIEILDLASQKEIFFSKEKNKKDGDEILGMKLVNKIINEKEILIKEKLTLKDFISLNYKDKDILLNISNKKLSQLGISAKILNVSYSAFLQSVDSFDWYKISFEEMKEILEKVNYVNFNEKIEFDRKMIF
jgi:hypothetical protein